MARAARRGRPGRRGDLPVVHLRVDGQRLRPARRACRRFVDIRPDTLNLDERLVEAAITPRTRAIMVVHYAGVGCEMDVHGRHRPPPRPGASSRTTPTGCSAAIRGRLLGSFGATSTLSFHETKNLTCGEGGALVINDPALVERAEILREKGTNRSRFFRGAGRQVHLGRRRLQLPAVGDPGRLPVGAARGARRDPGAAPRHLAALRRGAGRVGGADGRRHADRAAALRAPGAPLLPAAAVARGAAGPDRAPARPADPGGVPLPAAAPLRPGRAVRRPGRAVSRSPKRSPIGWCGCRCTTT